jgi:hypothetical protein
MQKLIVTHKLRPVALDTDYRARPDQNELDPLAEDCMQDHQYTGLFTSAPLKKLGGRGPQQTRLRLNRRSVLL